MCKLVDKLKDREIRLFMWKILGIIFLSFMINWNVLSEEIILDCKGIMYKYVKDGTNVLVYSTHVKRDEGKWHRWPYTGVIEENKHFLKSLKEVETIIDGYKVTSKSKKIELLNGDIAANSKMTIDFKKKMRSGKGTWKGKPYNSRMKCKKVEN